MRISKTKNKILKIMTKNPTPLDAIYLTTKINVNKTTIYRELENLLKDKIISEVDFGDGKKRYELASNHHHHVVCKDCGKINEITSPKLEQDIKSLEKKISLEGFLVLNHNLEFFGKCQNCKP